MRREDLDDLIHSFLAINAMLREEAKALKRAVNARREEAKHNPNWRLQPRAPRGTADGGQWVGDSSKPTGDRTPKQSRPSVRSREDESEPRFFDPIDDNPYIWRLRDAGLLQENASVADFYNLRFDLTALRGVEFEQFAHNAGLSPAALLYALNDGSSVMADRAIGLVEGIFDNPGIAGTNIVARDRAFREYVRLSGIRPEHQQAMLQEILMLAGFTESEYQQHQLDVGVGLQFPFLVGGGGPRATPGIAPRAGRALTDPRNVWNLGPVTRGRVIEAALGHNLPANFRIIDRFSDDGVATSIKSIDLGSATYHRPETLYRKLRGFVDQLRGFRGATYARRTIRQDEITGRTMDLVVPHIGTAAQQRVIDRIIAYARARDVVVNVIVYP